MSTKSEVNKWLKIRLIAYVVISVAITCFVTYDLTQSDIFVIFPITGLVLGCLFGIIFSRILKISWDKNGDEIISRLDIYGFMLLVVYILFEIFREKIVDYFISGPSVATTSFALLAGILFGRVIGMRRNIRTVLQEN